MNAKIVKTQVIRKDFKMGKMVTDYNINLDKINKELISKRVELRFTEKLLLNTTTPMTFEIGQRKMLISEIKKLEVEHSYIKRELEFL